MKKIFSIALLVLLIISFLPTAAPALAEDTVKILGADDVTETSVFPADTLGMDRWLATSDGTVTELRVKAVADGNIILNWYEDDGQDPYGAVGATEVIPIYTGWNTIPYNASVYAGSYYWIAYITDIPCLGIVDTGGASRSIPYTFNSGFPDSLTTADNSSYSLCAAWGSVVAAPPVIINSPAGASDISSNQATLNGELVTADGTTTVHIYWGETDGGTNTGAWSHVKNIGVISVGTFSKNITGLTDGQTYYYRCYASNSSGEAWAENSSSFLAHTPIKIFGAEDQTGIYTLPGNRFILDKWNLSAGTTNVVATQIKVKCMASANIKVALYADNGGEPGDLITAAENAVPVVPGWNIINLPSTSIDAGLDYWIAFISDNVSVVTITNFAQAVQKYQDTAYADFTFPAQADSGLNSADSQYSLTAVWGMATAGLPEVENVSTGASNITATSATLNGILTSTGGAATNVRIYWGTSDGGTNTAAWEHAIDLGIKDVGSFSSDITGLVNDQTYYYRCFASNFTGTAWASDASFFLAHNPVKIIGADDQTGTEILPGSNFILDKWSLPAGSSDVTVTQIRVKSNSSGNIKVALYNDNNDEPGDLLVAVNDALPIVLGWNIINVPPTAIDSDADYWIGFVTDTDNVSSVINFSLSNQRYKAVSYNDFTFPATAGTGFASETSKYSLTAAWGAMTISPPIVVNASSGASDITSTTARLNGVLSSTGGSATTIHIYWGTADGGTTPSAWDHDENIGVRNTGKFSAYITGLTDNQVYYYKCMASNSSGTSWANTTSAFLTHDPVKIIGADDQTGGYLHSANTFILDRWTLPAGGMSGIETQIRVKCSTSGNIKVALYLDNNGEPGTLVDAINTDIPVEIGWNVINFPTTAISAGTKCWIAFITDTNCVDCVINYSLTNQRSRSASYTDFTFPSTAGTGFTSDTNKYSLTAVWGIPVYTPPEVNNASGISSVTDISVRLNGILTSTGGKSTTVHIYWGTTDGGTNSAAWEHDVNLGIKTLGDFYTDISGLTKGQTYYYACSASNSIGTVWASPSISFVAQYVTLTPVENTTKVAVDASVQAKFNLPVTAVNLSGISISPNPGGVSASLAGDGVTLTIAHDNFDYSTIYIVTVPAGAVKNGDNTYNAVITWSFKSIMNAPAAIVTPADDAITVALDTSITAVFNQSVTAVALSGITISPNPGGISASLVGDGTTLNIAHDNLVNGITYTLTIPADTVKNSDNVGNAEISWSFTSIMAAPAATLTPTIGSTGIPLDDTVQAGFNQLISVNDLSGISISPDPGAVSTSLAGDGMTLNITHDSFLNGMIYTVTIPSGTVLNSDNIGNAEITWSFTAILVAPTAALTPTSDSTRMPPDTAVQAVFNQTLTVSDLSGISISPDPGVVSASLASDGMTLDIAHNNFANSITYTVTIPAGAVRNSDNIDNAEITWSFTTIMAAPAATLTPTAGSTGQSLDTALQAVFNQTLTVNDLSGISISPDPGVVSASLAGDGMTLNITHNNFANGITYTITIPSGAVKNSADVANTQITWSFTAILDTPAAVVTPENNAVDVTLDAPVQTTLNQTVTVSDLSAITISPDPGAVSASLASDGVTLNIAHANFLTYTIYTVTIPANTVINSDNIGNAEINWSFTSLAIPPVATVTPANNSTRVALDAAILATFDQAVTLVNTSGVTLSPDPGSVLISLADDGRTLIITHDSFIDGTLYTITIAANTVQNIAGQGNAALTWSFTTILAAPTTTIITPVDGAINVSRNAAVQAVFNQSITAAALSGIAITPNPGGVTASINSDGITLNIAHSNFAGGTVYTVTIPSGAVVNSDSIGNAAITWRFTTIATPQDNAQGLKAATIDKLNSARTSDKTINNKIDIAIRNIQDSLNPNLWIDENHLVFHDYTNGMDSLITRYNKSGKTCDDDDIDDEDNIIFCLPGHYYNGITVFHKEKVAVVVLSNGSFSLFKKKNPAIFEEVIHDLVQADNILAKTAITDAKNTPVVNPLRAKIVAYEIARAEAEYQKALQYNNKGEHDKAITSFGRAWLHAELAMKFAQSKLVQGDFDQCYKDIKDARNIRIANKSRAKDVAYELREAEKQYEQAKHYRDQGDDKKSNSCLERASEHTEKAKEHASDKSTKNNNSSNNNNNNGNNNSNSNNNSNNNSRK